MIGGGVAIASYVGMGFYFSDDIVTQWRAPMGIPLFAPIIVLCAVPFLPESPRYLLLKERPEEARKVYDKLNEGPAEFAELHEEIFTQMQRQAAYDRIQDHSWMALFTRPTYRRRVIFACLISALNQATGVLVISNYGQTFYKTLGFGPDARQILQGNRDISKLQYDIISSPHPLTMPGYALLPLTCLFVVALLGNFLGSWVIDRVGRKAILLFAFSGCLMCLVLETIMVALYAGTDNKTGQNAGVAFLYIFLLFYSSGIDVGTYVYLGEMFPNHIRVKGIALSLASLNITAAILLSVTNKAFSAIGWKYFLVSYTVQSTQCHD